MYKLAYKTHFSASHRIEGYNGKCKNMHGHNWEVKVEIKTYEQNELGITLDFKDLKKIVNNVIDKFDHTYLNDLNFLDGKPTAENISKYIYYAIDDRLDENSDIHQVTVKETDKYSITYKE